MALMRIKEMAVWQVEHCQTCPISFIGRWWRCLGQDALCHNDSVIPPIIADKKDLNMLKMMPTPIMIKALCLWCKKSDRRWKSVYCSYTEEERDSWRTAIESASHAQVLIINMPLNNILLHIIIINSSINILNLRCDSDLRYSKLDSVNFVQKNRVLPQALPIL